ncbi:YceI family protein [Solimonas soli]|uniref:YceI family protein n=1 Tax=Solimonas soli TaxID=413479 RepID=UPI0004BAB594|nr:YceI family protein [Solimonas soli]
MLKRLALALVLLLAACQAPAPRPTAEAMSDAALAQYRAPLAGEGVRYRLDAAASRLTIYAFRGGAAAKYGHNHVLAAPQLEGELLLPGEALRGAQFTLRLRLDQLQIDDAALRAQTGGSFASLRSAADIEGTQRNMLKSLDAAQYPDVVINSIEVAGDWPLAVARIAVTLHGVTREQRVALRVERDAAGLRASGALALRQSDYGVQPFSILGGALSVQDELAVEFRLVAKPSS